MLKICLFNKNFKRLNLKTALKPKINISIHISLIPTTKNLSKFYNSDFLK